MANKFLANVATTFNKGKFQVKKYSPEILIASGIVGVIVGTVLACKESRELDDVLYEHKTKVDQIHENKESNECTDKEMKKELTTTYIKTGWELTKLYAPAVLTEGAAIASILIGTGILKKRNVASAAALATLSESFNEYRKRVAEKYGEEAEKAIRLNTEEKTIEEPDEDGRTIEKTIGVSKLGEYSDYAFYFDKETSPIFENCMDYNIMYARSQEQFTDDIRRAKGYVTYGDIVNGFHIRYDSLNDYQKKAMLVAGYVNDTNPDKITRVDFRIMESYRELEDGSIIKTIVIDPNIEGSIYDRIKNV